MPPLCCRLTSQRRARLVYLSISAATQRDNRGITKGYATACYKMLTHTNAQKHFCPMIAHPGEVSAARHKIVGENLYSTKYLPYRLPVFDLVPLERGKLN